jgi:hypothetical protein
MDSTPPAENELRWGRVLLAVLLVLLLAEGTMQAFVYKWSGERYRSLYPYRWSAYGLVRNNPELTSVSYKINPNGFRNLQTFTQQKPEKTLRIIVLGGSVMYSGLGGTVIEGIDRVDSSSTVAQYLEQDLRADPELAGIGIEVINASVNFNRIMEVSGGYISEWAFWDPDIVIVGGSGNNFLYGPAKGMIKEHKWLVQSPHPWEAEFQRIANDRSVTAFAERGISTLENYFASVGVARKGLIQVMDVGFSQLESRATRLGILGVPAAPKWDFASFEEYDEYINDYLGYAAAMAAVAKRRDQEMAFFWEHLLGHLPDIKPLSPVEQILLKQNQHATWRTDRRYDDRARAAVGRWCADNGLHFLDPLERLKTYDGTVFIDYLHYTREGNRFMAKFMYDSLEGVIHRRAARLRRESP